MKILYFYEFLPTKEELSLAEEKGYVLRDACAYREGEFLETCDAVMGKAPKAYAEKYGVHTPEAPTPTKTKATK